MLCVCLNFELVFVFQGVGVFGWLVVGEGLPTVRVLPVQHCQKHCSSFNLWLTPGDMGNTSFTSFNPLSPTNTNDATKWQHLGAQITPPSLVPVRHLIAVLSDLCPFAVYADPRYWQMELFPGRGQNIICDGSAF